MDGTHRFPKVFGVADSLLAPLDFSGAVEAVLVLERGPDLIAASNHDAHSVGPSIRPICTRCYFTMTHMIQVCSKSH